MATTPRRGKPFVWITWVTGLMAGSDQCAYPGWMHSHYKDVPEHANNFDLDRWKADHDERVKARATEFEATGHKVRLESENWIRVGGDTATLIGKPDIIASEGGQYTIADSKKKQHTKDLWQIWTYLYMLPKAWKAPGLRITGELFYENGQRVVVMPQEFDAARKKTAFGIIRLMGEAVPPQKTPSIPECAKCTLIDCDERAVAYGTQAEDLEAGSADGDF